MHKNIPHYANKIAHYLDEGNKLPSSIDGGYLQDNKAQESGTESA